MGPTEDEGAKNGTRHRRTREGQPQLARLVTSLFSAATAEKNSRDRLYELASLVAPVEDTATKLRKAAEKLDKAIAEQKLVIAQTGVLPPKGHRVCVVLSPPASNTISVFPRWTKLTR